MSTVHIVSIPWTGLGLYNGFRGNRWLRNRIRIFKQFVVPSLLAQSRKDFVLHCCWRWEEKSNPLVQELEAYLKERFQVIFTYGGVMFWDDKYPDDEAERRLLSSLHQTLSPLTDTVSQADEVIWTLQPSDDCYRSDAFEGIRGMFEQTSLDAFGFKRGYVMNYLTGELAEWNPTTNPPFFSIRFKREVFLDPLKHATFTGPYKSHEYVGDKLKYAAIDVPGFLVGTHTENISTIFNHPFAHPLRENRDRVLGDFGLRDVGLLKLKPSIRKWFLRKLPPHVQRKVRYWVGERFWAKIYHALRN